MDPPAVQDPLNGAISAVGLSLHDPNLPLEEFEQICWMLGKMHEAVRFAIGDALIQGEELYGEQAYQAFEALNLSEDARTEYRRVSARVPRSRRRRDLSWSHHRAVAALTKTLPNGQKVPDGDAQKEWLKKASDERLSHHELREALRDGEPPRVLNTCRCCGRALG